jgi:hypothetical protein
VAGRAHQIRVHLAECGLPIVNDPYYNRYYIRNEMSQVPAEQADYFHPTLLLVHFILSDLISIIMKRSAAYVVLISLSGILLAVPSSVPGRTGGGLASLPRILVPVLPEREARLFAHNLDLDLTAVNCTVNANVIDIECTLRVMIHVYLIADDGAWEMYISLFFFFVFHFFFVLMI